MKTQCNFSLGEKTNIPPSPPWSALLFMVSFKGVGMSIQSMPFFLQGPSFPLTCSWNDLIMGVTFWMFPWRRIMMSWKHNGELIRVLEKLPGERKDLIFQSLCRQHAYGVWVYGHYASVIPPQIPPIIVRRLVVGHGDFCLHVFFCASVNVPALRAHCAISWVLWIRKAGLFCNILEIFCNLSIF